MTQFQNTALEKTMKVLNTSDQQLSYQWDGDTYVFPPGEEIEMPYWLARHFEDHLSKHGLRVSETEQNACGICGKLFDTKRELGAHSLSHRKA